MEDGLTLCVPSISQKFVLEMLQSMEPIQLSIVPHDRYNKVCFLCETKGRESKATTGACMTCNRNGCKQSFHVTCAQSEGLLCEESGHYTDNVKYTGYCTHHYQKLRKDRDIKTIPPFRPLGSNYSTPEKDTSVEKISKTDKVRTKAEKRPNMQALTPPVVTPQWNLPGRRLLPRMRRNHPEEEWRRRRWRTRGGGGGERGG
ncbi:hypothetical protein BSL78_09238 [Apostichopus japonicus]|uniref:PHD-type domain-containing protein n=1 Tax=Stichopus japonicus TaxID=307972 RepID=A0A2G8L0Q4_STIJA|nr:hypothetical protein BSL78_09238 [Apostichopus japonicus]